MKESEKIQGEKLTLIIPIGEERSGQSLARELLRQDLEANGNVSPGTRLNFFTKLTAGTVHYIDAVSMHRVKEMWCQEVGTVTYEVARPAEGTYVFNRIPHVVGEGRKSKRGATTGGVT